MAEETDISSLKEAFYAQQKLLQMLNTEVEVERDSAATAASEALSMILRLQGEKASLKMEASQYKRMAEAKVSHAEEALAIFEDLIYQREMEIASLEFQVQAYRYKLISLGCNDLAERENKFPENICKYNSLPQLLIKEPNTVFDRRRSLNSAIDVFSSPADDIWIQEIEEKPAKEIVDLHTCFEKIKKWDERVKENAEIKESGRNRRTLFPIQDQVKKEENLQERKEIVDSASASSVHDVFEVPQTTGVPRGSKSLNKIDSKLNLERENRFVKPDLAAEETDESPSKFEAEKVKAMFFSVSHDRKVNKPRNASKLASELPLVSAGNSQIEYQQLNGRIERLERPIINTSQEITAIGRGEEELNFLKEIREQLKSIESEMKAWKNKKSVFQFPEEPSLDPLQEAMLYFWI